MEFKADNFDNFDIDEWRRLAADDAHEFERRSEAAIRAVIEQAPPEHQARLLRLQARIDLERRRAKDAVGCNVAAPVHDVGTLWGFACRAADAERGENPA